MISFEGDDPVALSLGSGSLWAAFEKRSEFWIVIIFSSQDLLAFGILLILNFSLLIFKRSKSEFVLWIKVNLNLLLDGSDLRLRLGFFPSALIWISNESDVQCVGFESRIALLWWERIGGKISESISSSEQNGGTGSLPVVKSKNIHIKWRLQKYVVNSETSSFWSLMLSYWIFLDKLNGDKNINSNRDNWKNNDYQEIRSLIIQLRQIELGIIELFEYNIEKELILAQFLHQIRLENKIETRHWNLLAKDWMKSIQHPVRRIKIG